MSYTYDLSNNIGKVRNLINDTTQSSALMSDEEITSFLTIKGNDLLATAALCCRKIAANKALVAKTRRAGNYSESSEGIYKAYLELAKMYEEQALSVPADASAEQIVTDFNYNQLISDKIHRGETLEE